MREIEPGLLMKFEMDQAGASHKARAARWVVREALAKGLVVPGVSTVIEKTGGNFGLGPALACREAGVPVALAIGLSFSVSRREYLRGLGVELIGEDQLRRGWTPRQVLEARLSGAEGSGLAYYYPDQFNNPACVDAHQFDTGAEIVSQLADLPQLRHLHLVACAGTGAHITGIGRALRAAGYALDVTLVEPAGCRTREGVFIDHPLEGMAVGVPPPLLDWSLVNATVSVETAEAYAAQIWMTRDRGYWIGRTSAACLAVALRLARRQRAASAVLVIAYDHGSWYGLGAPPTGPASSRPV